MREERLVHKGYLLELYRYGPGWRLFIFAPGAKIPMNEGPLTRREAGRDQIVTEAKQRIDRTLRDTAPPRQAPASITWDDLFAPKHRPKRALALSGRNGRVRV